MKRLVPANIPPILYGAGALALLSLAWSTHEITALVDEGRYGLSVALAGDVGWLAVLRAEYKRTPLLGRQWIAPVTGWAIALGVAALLVAHGVVEDSLAKALAGPIVVLVAKIVWALALAELRDPAELTPEQEAEIASVMRDSEYEARLHAAQLAGVDRAADAEIARIRAEARITLARDDADAEIRLERIDKIREIERRSPVTAALGEPPAQSAEPSPEPPAHAAEPAAPGTALVLASALATAAEPQAPSAAGFGFSAHLSTQSAQRAEAIEKVAELLAQDRGLTSGQVAEALSVSPATAKRYLREARKSA